MTTTTAPRAAVSAVWLELQRAQVHGAVSFTPKAGSPSTVVVGCWDAAAVARVARALGVAGYDVHTPTGPRPIVEAQDLADVIDELTAEEAAAVATGDLGTAEHKRATIEAAHVLMHHAGTCHGCG